MVLGFLASFAGIFLPFLEWAVVVPCQIALAYFIWIIDFFSKPWAMKTVENVSWFWLAVFYIFILAGTRYLNKKIARLPV